MKYLKLEEIVCVCVCAHARARIGDRIERGEEKEKGKKEEE